SPAPERVLPWLYRVVRNGALSAGRGEARRRRREGRASASEAWFAAADDHLDGREATRLLAELPTEQREVVVARLWGGLACEGGGRAAGPRAPAVAGRAGRLGGRDWGPVAQPAPPPRGRPERRRAPPGRLAPRLGGPGGRRHALRRRAGGRPARAGPVAVAGA